MNYQTMTSKQLSQALTQAKIKGRSKATTKAQKIALLLDNQSFEEKFKALYFKERSVQELRGVVAIRTHEMAEKYIKLHGITLADFNKSFALLKLSGKLYTVIELKDELIAWNE